MIRNICVVENARHWKKRVPQIEFVSVEDYLFAPEWQDVRPLKIINLANNYGYLGSGYYVSLVAEARGHKVLPNISTMQALSKKEFYLIETDDLNAQIQKDLANITDNKYELSVYFGKNVSKKYEKISRMFFNLFPCPFFKVYFRREKQWILTSIRSMSINSIPESHLGVFLEALAEFTIHRWGIKRLNHSARYDLAILYNPNERFAPSDDAAIQKFIKAGKHNGLDVEVIEKKDFAHLPEFDGLFIRETTAIDHHTFRFAKKAEKEKIVVIDDPKSILYCTNKIFLNELFKREGIPRPKTFILSEDNLGQIYEHFSFPIIIKIPDGSFSRGVVKVEDPGELAAVCKEYFKRSDYIIAQEFMPTEFDWRIGVFDGRPLFAAQYRMAPGHWQVIKRDEEEGTRVEGDTIAFSIGEVPEVVIDTAVRAANLIGRGLYGVDLKQSGEKCWLIEVNVNPNIDAGNEDQIMGDALYREILGVYARRIRARRKLPVDEAPSADASADAKVTSTATSSLLRVP